ncbi:MAG: ABC transporter ATP-binding protein [Myxococcota bacterium]
MSFPIVTRGLTRSLPGGVEIVHPLDLDIAAGECFGLVGPNGSGKSTVLGLLTTLIPPTRGEGSIGGHALRDLTAVRARIGVVFQAPSLDLRLSALENLDFYAALHRPAWRAPEREARALAALATMGLADRAREEVGQHSWGMRRRVEVARALLTEPGVLFLDEPTTGLDPQTRAVLWDHLAGLRRDRGLTIVVATHDMEEAARCDRLGVLLHGHLVAVGTPAALSVGHPDLGAAFLALTGHAVAAEAASRGEALRARFRP